MTLRTRSANLGGTVINTTGIVLATGVDLSSQINAAFTQANSAYEQANTGSAPKINSIVYPGDDQAANTAGGQTVYLVGSGFASNATVYINGNSVPSVTYISAGNLSISTPALATGTYPVYVINPDDGATAIRVPGLIVSGEPTWNTAAGSLNAGQAADGLWSYTLSATGDAPITYALAAGSSLPAGVSLNANGVISGTISSPPETQTTYTFSVVATDAQLQDSTRQFSVTATVGEGVLFANNVLLIHADGTNNGNNHTFLDSSNNNFAITRFGNATQGSYSPFSQTGWSGYFDGSGDYLTAPSNAAFDFGTGDFTIETWGYRTSSGAYGFLISRRAADANYGPFSLGLDGSNAPYFACSSTGSSWIFVLTGSALPLNSWFHLAGVRNGNTFALYVNGTSVGTATSSASLMASSVAACIGAHANGSEPFAGYISNARIVKGTAVYTSAFTPPTEPLAPIANTSLLALQSNRLVDEGPNNFALTRNGDASMQPFLPFAPGLLSSNSHSVFFDGTGDYLNAGNRSEFGLGTGDYTVEFWFYRLSGGDSGSQNLVDFRGTAGSGNGLRIALNNGYAPFSLSVGYGSVDRAIETASLPVVGRWYHVAVSRISGSTRAFLDGVQFGTTQSDSTNYGTSNELLIGAYTNIYAFYSGYISNLRIIKGTGLYNSNFTPSTTSLTAVANTVLLTCQSTTFADNSTNAFTITPNGNVAPRKYNPFGQTYTSSTYSTANVGGSVYVDGSSDYLTLNANATPRGTEDFTIEFWFYPLSVASAERYFIAGGASGSLIFGIANSGNDIALIQDVAGTVVANFGSRTQLTAGVWNHVVTTRNGNSFRCFINGALTSSGVVTSSYSFATPSLTTLLTASTFGYVSNMRINRGTALYTSAFTPPSAPVTNIANTSLLLNFTNAQIFDQTAKNVLECVGDVKVSTAEYKYGSGSMYFDGANDYLLVPSNNFLAFGTGPFTIEAWVNRSSSGATHFIDFRGSNNNGSNPVFYWQTNNFIYYTNDNTSGDNQIQSSNAITSSSGWTHLAIVRSGTTLTVYVNGVASGSVTYSTNVLGGNPITIGSRYNNTGGYTGYIDDLRISRFARYTTNFTPPTAAFPNK